MYCFLWKLGQKEKASVHHHQPWSFCTWNIWCFSSFPNSFQRKRLHVADWGGGACIPCGPWSSLSHDSLAGWTLVLIILMGRTLPVLWGLVPPSDARPREGHVTQMQCNQDTEPRFRLGSARHLHCTVSALHMWIMLFCVVLGQKTALQLLSAVSESVNISFTGSDIQHLCSFVFQINQIVFCILVSAFPLDSIWMGSNCQASATIPLKLLLKVELSHLFI